jgi:hypothetical protein
MQMAVNVANIVVGEATIKLGPSANATTIAAMDNFADVGATQNGVEISWEPDIVDIEIDQYGDAAKLIQSKVKVMVKTTLAEATLNNLAIAWNYDDETDGDDIKANLAGSGASTNTFLFGSQNVYPREKGLVIVGSAPGSSAAAIKTRSYYTKRAVSMESSMISMKRAEATMFAVGFRILPKTEDTNYEYGKIIDQQ